MRRSSIRGNQHNWPGQGRNFTGPRSEHNTDAAIEGAENVLPVKGLTVGLRYIFTKQADGSSPLALYLAALAETPCCGPLVSATEDKRQREATEAPYGASVVESWE